MKALFAAVLTIFVSSTLALQLQNVFEYEINEVEKDAPFLKSKLHNLFDSQTKIDNVPIHRKLTSFAWKDCGKSSADINIKTLSISPDPLSFPGPLNVATTFNIKKTLVAPLQGDIKMFKKIRGEWYELPCLDSFGSCHYDDVCALLDSIKSSCPPQIKAIGIDCACPLKSGPYKLQKTTFDIMATIIPEGDYHIVANITKNSAETAVCLDVYLSVE